MTRNARAALTLAAIVTGIVLLAPAAHTERAFGLRVGVVVRDSYAWPRYGYGWPDCSLARRAGACRSGPYDVSGLVAGPAPRRRLETLAALPTPPTIQFKLGPRPLARPLFARD